MFIKQSTAVRNLVFRMLSTTDGFNVVTGLTVTVTLSKNGGAFAAAAGAVSEIANGYYMVAANATDSNTLGTLALYATGTGAKGNAVFEVVAFDPRSATNLGLSGLPTASPGAANGVLIAGTNVATTFSEGVVITKSTGTALYIAAETGVEVIGTNGDGFDITGAATALNIFASGGLGVNISGTGGGMLILASAPGGGEGLTIGAVGDGRHGLLIQSPSGDGVHIEGDTKGIYAQCNSGHGLHIYGGVNSSGIRVDSQGNGDGVTLVHAGSGVDLRANITGNLTGNVSGSVGSVAGNVAGNIVGNVQGAVHALDTGAIVAGTIADGALTAAKFAANFITDTSVSAAGLLAIGGAGATAVWAYDYVTHAPSGTTYGNALVNFGQSIESGITFKQAIRAILAVCAGKSSGGGSGTVAFENAGAGGSTRVSATVDANGNRTAVTLNL